MSKLFKTFIDAVYPSGGPPRLNELTDDVLHINKTSTASKKRCFDVWIRAHIYAAAAVTDLPLIEVQSRDLYLPDEYASFSHSEKLLTGMILAFLQRQESTPFKTLPYASRPRRYQIVRSQIDFESVRALNLPSMP